MGARSSKPQHRKQKKDQKRNSKQGKVERQARTPSQAVKAAPKTAPPKQPPTGKKAVGQDMTEAMREICDSVKALLVTIAENDVHRYDVGVDVNKIRDCKSGKYGTGGVSTLAKETGRDEDTLCEWADVPRHFPDRKAFMVLAALRNAKGVPLSYSHFMAVSVDWLTPTQRNLLLGQARTTPKGKGGVRWLKKKVNESNPAVQKRKAANSKVQEIKPGAGLRKMKADTAFVLKNAVAWEPTLLSDLRTRPPSEELAKELADAIDERKKLRDFADASIKVLEAERLAILEQLKRPSAEHSAAAE